MLIRWTALAQQDLADIGDFIALDNRVAASATVRAIFDQVQHLSQFPKMGRPVLTNVRQLVIRQTPYLVHYRLTDAVEILRVYHGRRRWPERG
ncbi:MAG: type II toxin-antitoxin system RelE/ParE family toxin [Planctomycetota bacterium]